MDNEDDIEQLHQSGKDILQIVSQSLKEAKWLKLQCTVKVMVQLTAVSEYIKLRQHYLENNHSIKPAMNASLTIA